MTLDRETTKNKFVDLKKLNNFAVDTKKLYNFVVEDIFILIHN
jgi:hypothetical protein